MNLQDVNTVGELVLENERTLTPEEKVMQLLGKLGPDTHLKLVTVMVAALRDFHVDQAKDLLEEGEVPTAWIVDATHLDVALTQLQKVKL